MPTAGGQVDNELAEEPRELVLPLHLVVNLTFRSCAAFPRGARERPHFARTAWSDNCDKISRICRAKSPTTWLTSQRCELAESRRVVF